MDAYELPEEFAHLQAQDMSKIGFINDVIRGIKKVLTVDKPETKIVKEVVQTSSTNIESLVKRGNLALSGRSSRSFLSEQNYQTLKNSLGKGDYLFIQFGHNDEKTNEQQYPGLGTYPSLDWSTLDNTGKDSQGRYSYEYILAAYYINLAKNKGAVPVLETPITRRGAEQTISRTISSTLPISRA